MKSWTATWRSWSTASALLLAPVLAAAQTSTGTVSTPAFGLFPESERVWRQLRADPRAIQLSAAYYRLHGKDIGDVALGHGWGMARWNIDQWDLQWNLEGAAFSRFLIGGTLNSFETVDFFANLPVAARRGPLSARLMLFHESSHLGDDYIRRTRQTGFRYSIDGMRLQSSLEALPWLRLYGGGTYLLHTLPSPARKNFQWGFELTSPDLGCWPKLPTSLFLAQDFQSHENVQWNVNSRTVAGVRIGSKDVPRYATVQLGYFEGHSPYGQFYPDREHYADIGISLHF